MILNWREALWLSNRLDSDTTLVVAESAIDALSHAALNPNPLAFYASTAGGWSDLTRDRLRAVAASLPENGRVVLAFDNDDQGRRYEEQASELLAALKREIVVDLPPNEGGDWNDVLRAGGSSNADALPEAAPLPERTK